MMKIKEINDIHDNVGLTADYCNFIVIFISDQRQKPKACNVSIDLLINKYFLIFSYSYILLIFELIFSYSHILFNY